MLKANDRTTRPIGLAGHGAIAAHAPGRRRQLVPGQHAARRLRSREGVHLHVVYLCLGLLELLDCEPVLQSEEWKLEAGAPAGEYGTQGRWGADGVLYPAV